MHIPGVTEAVHVTTLCGFDAIALARCEAINKTNTTIGKNNLILIQSLPFSKFVSHEDGVFHIASAGTDYLGFHVIGLVSGGRVVDRPK